MLTRYLNTIAGRQDLTHTEASELSDLLIRPGHNQAQVGALLAALRTKGETAPEISGFAASLKRNALPFHPMDAELYDVAGTGGDGAHTINVSTLTAFVLAGAGLRVAKHGNRSVSSKCGSADVLHEAGVNIHAAPDLLTLQLQQNGICFIYAPLAHPAMKNVMEVRKALGIPSIFNLTGPLANPMPLTGQIVGVYREELMETMAEALLQLGVQKGAVVHGHGGIDEVSLSGPSTLLVLTDGRIERRTLDPAQLGFEYRGRDAIKGGTASENHRAMLRVLNGEPGPFRDVVLLNAAAALSAFSCCRDMAEAVAMARTSIDSGAALEKLNGMIALSNGRTLS